MNNPETEISISDLKKFWIHGRTQVIHCGAHLAEELEDYLVNGFTEILWIEAMPEIFVKLKERLFGINGSTALNACLWSIPGEVLEFNISSNSYSSSLLDFGTHSEIYPEVNWEGKIQLTTSTLDSLVIPTKGDPVFLVLDLQGAEFQVLLGGRSLLKNTNYIYVEVSNNQLYKDSKSWDEITQFLEGQGFKLVDWQYSNKLGWGNALYSKNEPKINSLFTRMKRVRSHQKALGARQSA